MKTRIKTFFPSLTLFLTSLTLLAVLSANAQVPSYVPTNGLVGYWPFNANANDESGNSNNGVVNGATLTTDRFGNVNKAYFFNGVNTYIDLLSAGLSSNPSICSYSIWFKTNTLYSGLYGETSILLSKRHTDNGPSWASLQIDQNCKVNFVIDGPAFNQDVSGGSSVCNNQWQHLVCVKNLNVYSVYLNSVLVNSQTISYTHSGSAMNMHVGHHGSWNTWFFGSIDDIGIWNRALTLTEIQALYNSCSNPALTATISSSSSYCQNSGNVSPITVVVTGGIDSLAYQWYSNTTNNNTSGSLISGATASMYSPPTATVGTRYYYCVITTTLSGCSVTSATTAVVVNPGPILTTQPVSSNVSVGGATNPMCVAYTNGSETAAYQWYSNVNNISAGGLNIPGATSNCYTPSSATAGATYYYAIVTLSAGGCSSLTSNTASVIITSNDTISTQLIPSQTICVGGTIPTPLSVSYSGGNGTPTYQWYLSPSNTAIAGATSSSYTPPVFTASGTYSYYVVVNAGSSSQTSNTASVFVVADPLISSQPFASQTLCQTAAPAPLTVTASGGTGTLLYQWYSNTVNTSSSGTLISGATANSYSPPAASSGTFYYYCVITTAASGCSVTSLTSTVVVNPGPTFTTQPVSSNVPVGGTTNQMCVTYINGTGTASYQWYVNVANNTTTGTAILGASVNCYTPPSATAGTNYYYSIVSLSGGGCSSITSNTAAVIITSNDTVSTQFIPSQTICVGGTIPTPLSVSFSGGNGTPNYQWYSWPNTPIVGATSSSYTPPTFSTSGTYSYYVVVNVGSDSQTSNTASVIVVPDPTVTISANSSYCQNSGNVSPITVVVTGGVGTPSYQWYSNTTNSNTGGAIISGANAISYSPPVDSSGTLYYYCMITQSGMNCSLNSPAAQIIVTLAPTFTTQPTSSNVCVGGANSQMCVVYANGNGTPSYQWYSNTNNTTTGGSLISGANSNCYTPPSAAEGTKYYYAIINLSGGGCSSITSNTASVIVTPDPVLATQPTATQTICVGGSSAPLTVAIQASTGIGAFAYQWFSNTTSANTGGTQIGVATATTYTPPVFNTPGTFYYYCVVTNAGNGCGTVTSQVASVVAVPDPTISAQPLTIQTLCQTAVSTSLTVTASGGTGAFIYQWYSNTTNNNTSGSLISGATASMYSPPTATVGTRYYYCVITTTLSGCSVTSATSTVVVNPGPTFTTQPVSSNVPVGGTTNQMCVTYINGTGTASYQWYVNVANNTTTGTAILGASVNCYTPPSATAGTNYYYSIVSLSGGGCSSITSNTAAVIITSNDTVSTQFIPSQTICVGGTIPTPLSVSFSGGNGTPNYQWYSWPNTPIVGATSSSYTPPTFSTSGTYSYYVVVNVGSDSQTSNTASVIVVPDPTVTISANSSYCQNSGNVSPITVVVTGGVGTPSYQWYSNSVNSNVGGTVVSDATAMSYSPSVAATGTTYYYCTISQNGANCSVNSSTAQINVTPAPILTTQPLVTQSLCIGETSAQLSVAYSNGTGIPMYQWYANPINSSIGGTFITGSTASAYTPPSAAAGTTYYYCMISYAGGSGCTTVLFSSVSQVIVDPSLCAGNTVQAEFSMAAQGCNPVVVAPLNSSILNPLCADVTYQWNIIPSNTAYAQFVAGTNSSSANPVLQFTAPGNYSVSLTLNSCGSITTNSQQILVATAPTVSIASASSCSPYAYMPGVNVAQADIISNTPVNSLSWSVNPNVQVTNSNSANPTIQFNQSGIYTIGLQVSNICGTGTDQTQVEILGDAISYFQDSDNDSFGNSNIEIVSCIQPTGYVTNGADCNDTLGSVNPSASEIIGNEIDENCDGEVLMFSFGLIESSPLVLCSGESAQVGMVSVPSGLPNYALQWYFKSGNNPAPLISNTSGWNIIPGGTASTLTVDPFTGTRTYACFVTLDASYGISNQWVSGAKVITYSSFAAQTIIGNPNVIPFNSYNYIVNSFPGHTYNWVVTNGAVASGQGTNNASVMWGQNGPYQVTLTESDGTCSGTSVLFAVNNNCTLAVSAASSSTNTFCDGTTLQLQAATSATGITYQWYLNGALIPNGTNQSITISDGGNYQVSINQNGCSAVSNVVSINQLPSGIIPSIIVDQANTACAGGDATLTVSGGNYTNLIWNNGLTSTTINVSTSGDFSITAIDENGCAVSAGPVSVNFSILDPVPICLVTVDEATGKNNVVWEPVTSDLINSYVVLKETNVANVYAQIGTVAYGSNGLFEDENSNPQVQANRYKLALVDTCGILSSNSDYHKTIHLSTNQGLGNNVNLIWSGYEGFDFGSYNIYRGASASSMTLLTTIASNLDSYTDINPPVGDVYYMIEVEGVSCDPQRTLLYSHSNILDASVGVEEYASTSISLYPNPATTSVNLQVNTSLIGQEYVVFDAVGKVLYKNKIQSTNEFIQLENFNNGNYFIKVNELVKRFVVQH